MEGRTGGKGGMEGEGEGGKVMSTHVSEPSILCFHPESLSSIFLNL
jgi:hypothetical protein